jgi:hypothetical protein
MRAYFLTCVRQVKRPILDAPWRAAPGGISASLPPLDDREVKSTKRG